ncbi:hypothetical protein [Streptomyces sp. NPDC093149]|uniref:hypothetical protein n=1 Tax=Streptomyces sp. NPDC093149 TaxID=3366031 RepID=UPI0038276069
MDRGRGGGAQRPALAAPYGHALVERGPFGGLQVGSAEEVGDLARHVEGVGQGKPRSCYGLILIPVQ